MLSYINIISQRIHFALDYFSMIIGQTIKNPNKFYPNNSCNFIQSISSIYVYYLDVLIVESCRGVSLQKHVIQYLTPKTQLSNSFLDEFAI